MRVLVLTTDTTPRRPRLRPTVTGQMVAALTSRNVSYTSVHPTRLLQELALGSRVALLAVDACSVGAWLPDVFSELRRRVLGPSRPAVVVIGDAPSPVHAPRLFASGVTNWLPPSQTSRLFDYWHWVCCQSNADLEGLDASRRLSLLEDQCAGRYGYFEMADGRLHSRVAVCDGWLSYPEICEFDSEFTRAVRRFVAERLDRSKSSAVDSTLRRGSSTSKGSWGEVLVRDALEQQLQDTLRWFMGTVAHTRFVESNVSAPSELLWRAEDLVDEGPLSRQRFAKGFLRHQLALVANDTALADVS